MRHFALSRFMAVVLNASSDDWDVFINDMLPNHSESFMSPSQWLMFRRPSYNLIEAVR